LGIWDRAFVRRHSRRGTRPPDEPAMSIETM